MDAAGWDQRYATQELVWSAGPNRFLTREVDVGRRRAQQVLRPVEFDHDTTGTAVDTLVRAHRPRHAPDEPVLRRIINVPTRSLSDLFGDDLDRLW